MNDPQRLETGKLIIILGLISAIGSLSVDTYLPSLPTIAAQLGAPASVVQQTVSAYVFGLAAAQLLVGPLSDRFGRRPVLLGGLCVYVLASMVCVLAPNVETLIAARIVQGLGASASVAPGRAVVRDVWSGNKAARAMSFIMMVMSFAPLLAPILGGQIHAWLGWRAVFGFLVGFGILLLSLVYWQLPETLAPADPGQRSMKTVFAAYLIILRSSRAWAYFCCAGLAYGALFAYLAGVSFVYIDYLRVDPRLFGFLFGINALGLFAANWINSRLVIRQGYVRMLGWGILASLLGAALLLLLALTHRDSLLSVVAALFLAIAPVALIGSNATIGLLDLYPDKAGAASALAGLTQYGLGAVAGILVGLLYTGTPVAMALVMTVFSVGALAGWYVIHLQDQPQSGTNS